MKFPAHDLGFDHLLLGPSIIISSRIKILARFRFFKRYS